MRSFSSSALLLASAAALQMACSPVAEAAATPDEALWEAASPVFDFESVDAFEGLTLDMRNPRRGKYSGMWADTMGTERVTTKAFPADVSAYEGMVLWVHSEKATGAGIAIVLKSENPASPGSDYYQANLTVDWEGWRLVRIAFADMVVKREPLGLAAIGEFRLASSGFGIDVRSPETVLKFDELRLYGGPAAGAAEENAPATEARGVEWAASLDEAVEKAGADGVVVLLAVAGEGAESGTEEERQLLELLSHPELRGAAGYRFSRDETPDLAALLGLKVLPSATFCTPAGQPFLRLDDPARFPSPVQLSGLLADLP
ncbi:MAG: hypothetical protein PWP23_1145 [Candidatus Sumerlaeota bacterium]|nr:hypothetical protein [Candidatus Sumerlaeota bacterium]